MIRFTRTWKSIRQRYWTALSFDIALILAVFAAIHAWNTRDLPRKDAVPPLQASILGMQGLAETLPGGGPGVVYFFAPWCGYCKRSIGHIDELVASGEVSWARAIALDFTELEEVQGFVSEVGLEQPVLLGNAAIAGAWNIRAFPTYFIMNSEGDIASRSVGYATKAGLRIRARLAK